MVEMSLDEIVPRPAPSDRTAAADPAGAPEDGGTWTLWLGPGVRPDLGERLVAAGGLAGRGRLHRELVDLAELLVDGTGPGRLVTTLGAVPCEDLGILRRFLAADPSRELVVLDDRTDGVATNLVTLPRTRLLPRPLTGELLAYLCGLPERLAEPPPTAPSTPAPTRSEGEVPEHERLLLAWQVLRDRLAGREDLAPMLGRLEVELGRSLHAEGEPAGDEERVDLGALAEELLAGLSLERDRRMRFLFRPEGELSVRGHRQELERCLTGLFDLVGRCSSADSVIRVRVTSTSGGEADPDAPVDVSVEFPDAPLVGVPLGAELDPETLAAHFGPEVSAALRTLTAVSERLGADLASLPARPGRRQVRLRLPRLVAAAHV